ncbi:C2H2 type zinc-finger-domain-containing protein [Scheffersomyces xylosifermentans]|uniref:C2H2 type zinc-finger-domain-containing protein n=1 Tax=Scheffersomyces xylosifermentans TaxID=1304137 RepID=UPI00315C9D23
MSTFMPQGSNPETSSFTCNTCGIKFVTAELQRQHMKTEWHRYNLKRRVAELPSISSEVFAEKILTSQQSGENTGPDEDEYGFFIAKRKAKINGHGKQLTKKLLKKQRKLAEIRGRAEENPKETSFRLRSASPTTSVVSEFSQFSLGDSVTHEVDSVADTGSELNYSESDFTDIDGELSFDDEDEVVDLDVEQEDAESHSDTESEENLETIPITHCFYCGQNNHEIENNIKHMYSKHGLYIPERTYLADLEGLLNYLSEVIAIDNECLVCGFEGKNLVSIRQHISSKGHCKIPYETKEEKNAVAEFYDFYVEEEKPKKTKSRKSVAFLEDSSNNIIVDLEDADGEQGLQEDERDDDDMVDDSGINDNYTLVQIDRSGVELTLPTGSRIGHRSMARYYRQNIALPTEASEASKTVALVDRRFASGLTSYEVTKQEKETRKVEQRIKNNYERKTKSSRVNFQKHHRDELLGPM